MNPVDNVTSKVVSTDTPSATKVEKVQPAPPARAVAEDSAEASVASVNTPGPVAVSRAVEQLNTLGASTSPALQFEISDETNVVVIKVINRSTGEIIRELPPEAVVDAATRGDDGLPALVEADA